MVHVPAVGLLIALLGLIFAVIGAVVLKRGRWAKRIGETPHCPKCDYILSGDQARCPECGKSVNANTVVRGDRPPQAVSTRMGACIGLLGLAILLWFGLAVFSSIDWSRHKSLSWLLRDLHNDGYSPAWLEIQRRLDNKLLSDSDQDAIVERGLQVQSLPPSSRGAKNVLDYIAARYADNKLTSSQADRFIAAALKVDLSVRTRVGARSVVPYTISAGGGEPGNWLYQMRTIESQIDDGPVQKMGLRIGSALNGNGWSTNDKSPPVATLGNHRLRVKVEVVTNAGNAVARSDWDDNATTNKRLTQNLLANFEVVEGETLITAATSPDASVLRHLLGPSVTYNAGIGKPSWLMIYVGCAGLPVDVAFNLFVRTGGREYPAGAVTFRKGTAGGRGGVVDFPNDPPSNIDFIFRSSEVVARETIDITKIWKGEIVFKNVPVDLPTVSPIRIQPGPASQP